MRGSKGGTNQCDEVAIEHRKGVKQDESKDA